MDSFVWFVTRADAVDRRRGWMAPAH